MAGHSQFKNIMYRKGAQDAKRAKLFTKINRELMVASKTGGADPENNARLRAAVLMARGANMPKDNIERAIKKGAGEEALGDYQNVRYEGYGPQGVAVIVETLTDNRNRTAPDLRNIFSKHGGNLAEIGSVGYLFSHQGMIRYPATVPFDTLFEKALNAEAEDVLEEAEEDSAWILVRTPLDHFAHCRDTLSEAFGDPLSAELAWLPHEWLDFSEDKEKSLSVQKLVDALEDYDDVQSVWINARLMA